MDFNFGTRYYVIDNYANIKQYVVISTVGDYVLGAQFNESPKYTLLQFLNDLCKDTAENGYAAIGIHRKNECFSTHEEARDRKARKMTTVYCVMQRNNASNSVVYASSSKEKAEAYANEYGYMFEPGVPDIDILEVEE